MMNLELYEGRIIIFGIIGLLAILILTWMMIRAEKKYSALVKQRSGEGAMLDEARVEVSLLEKELESSVELADSRMRALEKLSELKEASEDKVEELAKKNEDLTQELARVNQINHELFEKSVDMDKFQKRSDDLAYKYSMLTKAEKNRLASRIKKAAKEKSA